LFVWFYNLKKLKIKRGTFRQIKANCNKPPVNRWSGIPEIQLSTENNSQINPPYAWLKKKDYAKYTSHQVLFKDYFASHTSIQKNIGVLIAILPLSRHHLLSKIYFISSTLQRLFCITYLNAKKYRGSQNENLKLYLQVPNQLPRVQKQKKIASVRLRFNISSMKRETEGGGNRLMKKSHPCDCALTYHP
jgi:hypothetical protein